MAGYGTLLVWKKRLRDSFRKTVVLLSGLTQKNKNKNKNMTLKSSPCTLAFP